MTISGHPGLMASIAAEEASPPTPPASVTPGTPSITVTVPSGVNNALDVTWSATTNAVSYEVRYDSANPPTTGPVIDVTSVYRITGMSPTVWYIQVRAKSSTGHFSAWSTVQSGTPSGTGGGGGGSASGRTYPNDPVWNPGYSGSSPSYNPLSPSVSGGGKFTYTDGSWDTVYNGRKREPTPGDEASLEFTSAGATIRFDAGRIDQTDRAEMDADDLSFDGVLDGVGSAFGGRPAMLNAIITGGQGLKHGAYDPAVFPLGDSTFPDGRGPHRHSLTAVQNSYWTDTTLKGLLGGLPTPATDLNRDFIEEVVFKTRNGGNFASGMIAYWPTFVDGIKGSGFTQTGYIGRPRPLTGLGGMPLYLGNVVPPPQGLRLPSFECNVFKNALGWEFIAVWPNCWDGVNEWLPGGAHVAFLNSDGTPPASHPFVIPQLHWFASTQIPTTLTQTQAKNRQSAQVVDANPAAIYYGQRRDFWNYSNINVPLHAELLLCWDPTLAEAICWMINNYVGLGRITQTG